jgi:hypothetical protein
VVASGVSRHTGSCGTTTGSEAVFNVTLTGASTDLFVTTFASWNTVLYVRRDCCEGAELACNDNYDASGNSTLTLHALPAGHYYVIVDSGATAGPVTVDIYGKATKALAGDTCGNLDITSMLHSGSISSTVCGTQDNYTGSCFSASPSNRELVYWFRVDATTTASFSTCSGTTCGDTTLTLRSLCNTSSGMSEVACGDDSCSNPTCATLATIQSSVTATLAPGVYYLIVGSRGSSCAPFTLTASGIP